MRLRVTSRINVTILWIKQRRATMQDAFLLLNNHVTPLFIKQFFTGVKVDGMMEMMMMMMLWA